MVRFQQMQAIEWMAEPNLTVTSHNYNLKYYNSSEIPHEADYILLHRGTPSSSPIFLPKPCKIPFDRAPLQHYTFYFLCMQRFYYHLPRVTSRNTVSASRDKPWIDTVVKEMIKGKNRLYHEFKRNSNGTNTEMHKRYKKVMYGLIKQAKKCHTTSLNRCESNRDQWKVINDLIRPGHTKTTSI